jgi:hypothetical protein
MRTLRNTAAVAALFGSVLLLPAATEAQDVAAPSFSRHIPRPVPPPLKPALSSLQKTGTVKVTINVAIGSNIPAAQAIGCEVELVAVDASFFNLAFVSGKVTRSGSKGKCTISVPYIFQVLNNTTALDVLASVFTNNSSFTAENEGEFAQAFTPVPTGTTSLTVTLGL